MLYLNNGMYVINNGENYAIVKGYEYYWKETAVNTELNLNTFLSVAIAPVTCKATGSVLH